MDGCRPKANWRAGFEFGRPSYAVRLGSTGFLKLYIFEKGRTAMSGILWIIIVGFVAGIIARLLSPGPNNPTGFILTTVLGIAGAFLATFVGQAIGHYQPAHAAGFITATIA